MIDPVLDVDAELSVGVHDVVMDDAAIARVADAVLAILIDRVELGDAIKGVGKLDTVAAVVVDLVIPGHQPDDRPRPARVVGAQLQPDGGPGDDKALDDVIVVADEDSR